MRDFIKENLRIQLENLLYEVKDNFNELPSLIRSKITRVNSKEELTQLSKLAKKLANKYYDTFGGVYDGTGTYTFKITKSGNGFVIKSDMGKDDREYILGQEGKSLRLNAKAYTDQEANLNFKDMMDDENKGKAVFSPIVDAKIKILADDQMIKSIMDFDFEGSYTADTELEKNKELSTQSVASDEFDKRDKINRYKLKGKGSLSTNPKINRIQTQLNNFITAYNDAINPIDGKKNKDKINSLNTLIDKAKNDLKELGIDTSEYGE